MRFASHRDVARAIERAVRKAGIPVAYSAGFSPHPKISYSGGAPTGSASEAEYLELSVTRRCGPADIGRQLDAALPDGIDVIEVVEADPRSAGWALEASDWEVVWPGIAVAAAEAAVAAFLAAPSVEVTRLTSKGTKTLDARAAVITMTVSAGPGDPAGIGDPAGAAGVPAGPREAAGQAGAGGPRRAGSDPAAGCVILRMIVRQMTPAVRPDDILAALRRLSAPQSESPPVATRLWQGPLSALTTAETGAETGMSVGFEAPGRARPAQPPSAVSPSPKHVPDRGPARPGPGSSPDAPQSGRTIDKAMRLGAESAGSAPVGQARANEQLPRGTQDQMTGQRAREPYGRDCPDARNRAAEQTARTQ